MSATATHNLRKAHREAKLKLETARMEAATRLLDAKAKYDVLESSQSRKRRQPQIERLAEEKILRSYDRLRAINLTRDLERNFTSAKAMVHQLKTNVVGAGPKVRFHSTDKNFNDAAAQFFNAEWQKNSDFRGEFNEDGTVSGGLHFADQVALALASKAREGDCLAAFDDGFIEDSGKLVWWESDQLVNCNDIATNAKVPAWAKGAKQESGVLFDKWGRKIGYAVSYEHGKHDAKAEECSFIPAHLCRLIRKTWRFNQHRGTPDFLAPAADLQDLYEMRSSEMQTAKTMSKFGGVITKAGAGTEFALRNEDAGTDGTLGAGAASSGGVQYDRLEALLGGLMEYLDEGDEFKPLDFNRPNVNFRESFDFILRSAGAALGLSKTYTTLNTEASYTAFRGDLLLSWATFVCEQKHLERYLCDWVAVKAVKWAIRKGKLNTEPPEGWDRNISWQWPAMPAVDPLKESMAHENNVKNLFTTYADILGPEWKKKFEQLQTELSEAKDRQLPLMAFEKPKDTQLVFDQMGAPAE